MKILKFEASWCNPCKALDTVLESIQDRLTLEKYDVDDPVNSALVSKYGIKMVPVMVFVDNTNTEVTRLVGLKTKAQILATLNAQ